MFQGEVSKGTHHSPKTRYSKTIKNGMGFLSPDVTHIDVHKLVKVD
jgi:hypothetical protein